MPWARASWLAASVLVQAVVTPRHHPAMHCHKICVGRVQDVDMYVYCIGIYTYMLLVSHTHPAM